MGVTALFGGTFNPFHIGHYEMLKALQNDDCVDEIWIMPDKIPPHKVCDFMADDKVRIEMCNIAAKDFLKAKVCLIEFEREGKSYTFDTILNLKKQYPLKDFAFVMGGDMLVYFEKWYKHEELMKMISFITFRRTDTDNFEFDSCVKKFTEKGMKIRVKNENISDISSSEIRKDFLNTKKYLPEKIFEFLAERGEYSGKD